MSSLQVTAFRPCLNVTNQYNTFRGPAVRCIAPDNIFDLLKYSPKSIICSSKKCPKFMGHYVRQRTDASHYQHCTPVCLFGGKGKSENGNEASPWKSLEKAMSSLKKEQSLEDVLKQQMEKKEYYDGGSGGKPPGGGGGGGDGFGGTEDEGFQGIWDEIQQVTMATLAFIFLYAYIIAGDDIKSFLSDCYDYFFRGGRSPRIKNLLSQFGAFYRRLRSKPEYDPYWLEKEILCTTTWWDSPMKYRRMYAAEIAEIVSDTDIADDQKANDDNADNENAYSDNAYDDNANKDDDYNDNAYNDDDYNDNNNVKVNANNYDEDADEDIGDDEYF